jgi:hypothetical protein
MNFINNNELHQTKLICKINHQDDFNIFYTFELTWDIFKFEFYSKKYSNEKIQNYPHIISFQKYLDLFNNFELEKKVVFNFEVNYVKRIDLSGWALELRARELFSWFYFGNKIKNEDYVFKEIIFPLANKLNFIILSKFKVFPQNFIDIILKIYHFKYWILSHYFIKDIANLIVEL